MLEGQVLKSKCDSFWSQVKNGDRDGVLQAVKERGACEQCLDF